MNGDPETLKQFYRERGGKPVIIPQYERPDGNYPPEWLWRRQHSRIDYRIR